MIFEEIFLKIPTNFQSLWFKIISLLRRCGLPFEQWFWRRKWKCEKFKTTTVPTTDYGQILITKAHLSLWIKWKGSSELKIIVTVVHKANLHVVVPNFTCSLTLTQLPLRNITVTHHYFSCNVIWMASSLTVDKTQWIYRVTNVDLPTSLPLKKHMPISQTSHCEDN